MALLEGALNDPDDRHPDRTAFYLAQTYKDMGRTEDSIALYRKRADYGGWYEEVYWSLFQIAEMTQSIEDYLKAWNYRPQRAEALRGLMARLNHEGMYQVAYRLGQHAPTEPTEDILFIQRTDEQYGIKLQLAVAEYWIDLREDSKRHFEEILETPDLPDDIRELVENNLKFF